MLHKDLQYDIAEILPPDLGIHEHLPSGLLFILERLFRSERSASFISVQTEQTSTGGRGSVIQTKQFTVFHFGSAPVTHSSSVWVFFSSSFYRTVWHHGSQDAPQRFFTSEEPKAATWPCVGRVLTVQVWLQTKRPPRRDCPLQNLLTHHTHTHHQTTKCINHDSTTVCVSVCLCLFVCARVHECNPGRIETLLTTRSSFSSSPLRFRKAFDIL